MASREDLTRLAEEQAALRQVATLLAEGAPPESLFAVVAEQVARVLHLPLVSIVSFDDDYTATERASFSAGGELFQVGTRWSLDGTNVVAQVRDSGRPSRIDDYTGLSGAIAEAVRDAGIRSTVGIPIVVAGRLWGAMVVSSAEPEPLPEGTETRLTDFTELVATAISNTEARAAVGRLVDEQAALRRVATLVAQAVPPSELFAAVAAEVGGLLGADLTGIIRYESDGTVTPVAAWACAGEHPDLPLSWSTEAGDPATEVRTTRRPARIEDWTDVPGPIAAFIRAELGIRSSVGSPVIVEGRVWGALAVHSQQAEPLPADTESRLLNFSELVATAISNAQARAEVQRLAHEQAALRRVATLVAEGVPAHELFYAVAAEAGTLLDVDGTRLGRYEGEQELVELGGWSKPGYDAPSFGRAKLEGTSVAAEVLRTGRVARIDNYGEIEVKASFARGLELRSVVGAPIVVEGHRWGVMVAWSAKEDLPADVGSRLTGFTELVATAIANTEARAELTASRARLVAASDDARRRFERDLHDGVQQRLVSLALELRGAEAMAPPEHEELSHQLAQVGEGLAGALDDLRELSRGIHPAILSEGGLVPALRALARRSSVPIKLELHIGKRLAERVEAAAYYIVSEALANSAKYARATRMDIHVESSNGILDLRVHDDGVGGADPARGTGLTGLTDRVEALGGTIAITSAAGEGTSLHVRLPLELGASSNG